MTPTRRQPRRAAFSLIEMLAVLAVIATVTAVAGPRLGGALARYRADAAAKRVVADLALARSAARSAGGSRTVSFDVPAGTYQVVGESDPDRPSGGYTVRLADGPYGGALVSASFGGAAQVTFDTFGFPTAGGTVVVRCGGEQRTVTLDATSGKASTP